MDRKDLLNEATYDRNRAAEWFWQRSQVLGISRRRILQLLALGTGSTAATILAKPNQSHKAIANESGAIVKQVRPDWFYQMNTNLEMRWENMYDRGYIVPNHLFFVRNNNPTPLIEADRWRLNVFGDGVSHPRSFSYSELLQMPSVSVIRAIECAGNGRSFYQTAYGKAASGTQWKLGGIGVAEWTGVPMSEILERAGLQFTARDVMPISLDANKVQRPIPIEKALANDTLVVYAMNGDTLPRDHGFPVRLLVSGWVGIASIKWLGSIQVSRSSLFSLYNTQKYILIGEDYPVNRQLQAAGVLGKIATKQKPKSAFELSWDGEIPSGKRLLRGRSWSGVDKISKPIFLTNLF
ncbi:MAG: molybdopterin-dependent oxidoreductase [Prochloraceae cyanobacterium]|nr:molybdopterin-dependent oxidoreductase [Prochloraceae cyanobacterium]